MCATLRLVIGGIWLNEALRRRMSWRIRDVLRIMFALMRFGVFRKHINIDAYFYDFKYFPPISY